MLKLIIIALIGLLAGPAFAQIAITSVQQSDVQTPIFRATVVGRTTPAINYRPRSGDTKVDLVGTALLPDARGVAEVSGKKGHIEIDAHFTTMQPATHFGNEYLTYVLWAITPEGRPKNLGEVQIKGDDTRVEVTTELQAFALIVTAEPYFAVTQPSDVVVMENAVRDGTKGDVETLDAKYELLKRGSYLMNHDVAGLKVEPVEPGAPLDLAEARNAVELARIAGADSYASDSFAKAVRLLSQAELAREKRKRGNEVMMPARQAVQTAEDARLIALKRQEDEFNAKQRVAFALREREALDRAQAEEARRRDAERTAAAAKAAAERERVDGERARQDASRVQSDAEQALAAAEAAKQAAAADAQQARLQTLRAQAAVAVAEQEKNALRQSLREQLNAFLETRETARGLIMNVPDVLFDTGSVRLTSVAREKLARVSGILASHPDLHIAVEGHTDNVGGVENNQRLSQRRAGSVLAYLAQQKIPLTAVDTAGFGETRPAASNETSEGRQQNRRVELVVTGESIGVTTNAETAQ